MLLHVISLFLIIKQASTFYCLFYYDILFTTYVLQTLVRMVRLASIQTAERVSVRLPSLTRKTFFEINLSAIYNFQTFFWEQEVQ